jgi:TPR repeat protein
VSLTVRAKVWRLARLAFSAASLVWVTYATLGWLAPGALCRAGRAAHCTRAATEAYHADPRDGAAVRAYSQRGCELGSLVSCSDLGECYELGLGVGKDLALAEKLYRRACDAGVGVGCFNLGDLGEGGPGNPAQAQAFERACGLKYALGCRAALWRHRREPTRALALAQQGCDLADEASCALVALLHAARQPDSEATRDAIVKITAGCSENRARSCATLGVLYAAGAGVEQDLARATTLLTRACQGEWEPACDLSRQPRLLERMPSMLRLEPDALLEPLSKIRP